MSAQLIQFLLHCNNIVDLQQVYAWHAFMNNRVTQTIESQPLTYNNILLTTEHFLWSGNTPGMRHCKY